MFLTMWEREKKVVISFLLFSENTERAEQNKSRTDAELTLAKMQFLCADARSQERFQRISNPFYLLHLTVFYLSKIKDLSIRGTNLQQRRKKKKRNILGIHSFLIKQTCSFGGGGSW